MAGKKKASKPSKSLSKKSMKSVKGGAVDMFRTGGSITGGTINFVDGSTNKLNTQIGSQDIHF